jgi:ribosomal protein L5
MTRLQEHYATVVRPTLMKEFGYPNALAVPKLDKIVLNMGVGEAVNDSKKTQQAADALGLKEQIVFPEIDYDQIQEVRGLDIVICTTAKTDAEARALLKGFDMPFVN